MTIDFATLNADELTDADLEIAQGGYHNPGADRLDPVSYAVDYWVRCGFQQTLQNFIYQMN